MKSSIRISLQVLSFAALAALSGDAVDRRVCQCGIHLCADPHLSGSETYAADDARYSAVQCPARIYDDGGRLCGNSCSFESEAPGLRIHRDDPVAGSGIHEALLPGRS